MKVALMSRIPRLLCLLFLYESAFVSDVTRIIRSTMTQSSNINRDGSLCSPAFIETLTKLCRIIIIIIRLSNYRLSCILSNRNVQMVTFIFSQKEAQIHFDISSQICLVFHSKYQIVPRGGFWYVCGEGGGFVGFVFSAGCVHGGLVLKRPVVTRGGSAEAR